MLHFVLSSSVVDYYSLIGVASPTQWEKALMVVSVQ